MVRHRNLLERKYEFETPRSHYGDMFLKVLYMFHIRPEDIYIPPDFFDITQIEFRSTNKQRLQIEYVFKRLVKSDEYSIY